MFYTGLCMRERGRIQRVGLARSTDLYAWEKDTSGDYPLEIQGPHYESSLEEGRHWVSFRDPFCYLENGDVYLLAAARVNQGPLIRRGCVSIARETAPNQFEFGPPLFHPMRYDDVEVPCLVKLDGRYFLLGSIREDIKVHYWYADTLEGPYKNYNDNVLLPQGNYAARVSREGDQILIWNFFFKGLTTRGYHLMAPPKELVLDENGALRLRSFCGFDKLTTETLTASELTPLQALFSNPRGATSYPGTSCRFGTVSGFEAFLLQGSYRDFKLTGVLHVESHGKCGFVLRLDEDGDGYYLSLDLTKGLMQMRAWSHKEGGGIEEAFHYRQLQAVFHGATAPPYRFSLLAYEQYLEFSLNGYVVLTLADDHFEEGRVGMYVESATIRVDELQLEVYESPSADGYPYDLPKH
jgi:beta-fructofuranosidase